MCWTCTPPIELEDGTVLTIEQYEELLVKQREENTEKNI